MKNFGTAINCIDGRVQGPVADWVKLHGHVRYVDMITEPGVDKELSQGKKEIVYALYEKIRITVEKHQSRIIVIAGHFDCAANPVSFKEHAEQIKKSANFVSSWKMGVRVVGLYINEWNSADVICDSDLEFQEMRSFL